MRHGSLFSGIGGFDLAAEWMGWENVFHCEINEFCNKLLKYYWPNAKSYKDIKSIDFSIHRGEVDIISGGFPCQPFSHGGHRKGVDDSRYLWPEMLRAVREICPTWIVGENVHGLVNWNGGLVFDTIEDDLGNEGYKVIPIILSASSVNAPHVRKRIFFIAYSDSKRLQRGQINRSDEEKEGERCSRYNTPRCIRTAWENFPTIAPICDGDDGLPKQLDNLTFQSWRAKSLIGAGNAVVPPLVLQIFKTIQAYERIRNSEKN